MGANDFRGAKRGDRLTAALLNNLVGAGRSGILRQLAKLADPGNSVLSEPAMTVQVINTTSETIPAGAPVSLESPVLDTDVGLMNQRAFNVVLLEDATTLPLHPAVTQHAIAAGCGGDAYVTGACLVQFTDDNYPYVAISGLEVLFDSETSGGIRYGLVRFAGNVKATRVWIIGGNILSTGHEAIQYAATVTPAALYDPDVTTVYPNGLGNCWVYVGGTRLANRALCRHNFTGYSQPLLAGRIMSVSGVESLTFGADVMLAFTLDLP